MQDDSKPGKFFLTAEIKWNLLCETWKNIWKFIILKLVLSSICKQNETILGYNIREYLTLPQCFQSYNLKYLLLKKNVNLFLNMQDVSFTNMVNGIFFNDWYWQIWNVGLIHLSSQFNLGTWYNCTDYPSNNTIISFPFL